VASVSCESRRVFKILKVFMARREGGEASFREGRQEVSRLEAEFVRGKTWLWLNVCDIGRRKRSSWLASVDAAGGENE